MLQRFARIFLLLGCTLPGCMTASPMTALSTSSTIQQADKQPMKLDDEFNLHDPGDVQQAFALVHLELTRQTLSRIPPGSLVILGDESGRQFSGTMLRANADEIELLNSICKEPVPGPHGQKQCKTSHLPYQTFQLSNLKNFAVQAPPPPDFSAPTLEDDHSECTVESIVFKSGHRQRWGKPPTQDPSDQSAASAKVE